MGFEKVLVTGCLSYLGSETVKHFSKTTKFIIGTDTDLQTSVSPELNKLFNFSYRNVDLSYFERIHDIIADFKPQTVIHCSIKISSNLHANFLANALGTANLLQCINSIVPHSTFIFPIMGYDVSFVMANLLVEEYGRCSSVKTIGLVFDSDVVNLINKFEEVAAAAAKCNL